LGKDEIPPEARCTGRVYFAADPDERVAVCFYDLPKKTVEALRTRQKKPPTPRVGEPT
jgi:hypothetical protein